MLLYLPLLVDYRSEGVIPSLYPFIPVSISGVEQCGGGYFFFNNRQVLGIGKKTQSQRTIGSEYVFPKIRNRRATGSQYLEKTGDRKNRQCFRYFLTNQKRNIRFHERTGKYPTFLWVII